MAYYKLRCNLPNNQKNMENMVLAVDPGALFIDEIKKTGESGSTVYADECVEIDIYIKDEEYYLQAKGFWRQFGTESFEISLFDREITENRYGIDDVKLRKKELIRRTVLELFRKQSGSAAPWGILTGVRPTKIYHYLRDAGFSPEESRAYLKVHYGLNPNKADLLVEIGELQKPHLIAKKKKIGVYVGIPFCPTRCDYCSFAAYPLSTHGHLLEGFLEALRFEIHEMGAACRNLGLQVDFIYIGGGTPTVLNQRELFNLLSLLNECFPAPNEREFTVEAGRPETIDIKKLRILREMKVNRISVNPQTMNERTLKLIGRKHTVAQVCKAVSFVREAGIPCLNMDLILGLPGENTRDWDYTMTVIKDFSPENLTIHTLAPKRAATWDFGAVRPETNEAVLAEWLSKMSLQLKNLNYHPYYLYRQRRILANQENIGYCKAETEGIYNILMMEERCTILGLGGGAMTKWVDPQTLKVSRTPNPKCPATYRGRIKELVDEKVNCLERYVN